ncbi:MAG TPA: GIY-YIG nuclease family protein [Xanthobacteraceae bacterium]|jgi:putative endonuclease
MAGLVPAIPLVHAHVVRRFYLYILGSRPGGALYVGVTNLLCRVYDLKDKLVKGFSAQYGIDQQVHFEVYDSVYVAIQRENSIKHRRAPGKRG